MDLPRRDSPGSDFPLAETSAARLAVLDSAGSTNAELLAAANADPEGTVWPDGSALLTLDQHAGRGRLGRSWQAPAGSMLALSVLLRPRLADGTLPPFAAYPWFGLLAGAVMAETVAGLVAEPASVGLKWPNDVHIGGRKVCGVLAELADGGRSLVVGLGTNLTIREEELPIPTAISLTLAGAEPRDGHELADEVAGRFLASFLPAAQSFLKSGGDARASGVHARVSARCESLGRSVVVTRAGEEPLRGIAEDLDADGRIRVRDERDGALVAVTAGDVEHLRY